MERAQKVYLRLVYAPRGPKAFQAASFSGPALTLVELLIEPCVLPCCVPPVLDGPIQFHDFDPQTGSWQSKHQQRTPKPPNHMLYTTPIGHNDRMNNVKLHCYGKTQVNLTGFDLNYQRGVFRILHQRRAPSALKL